MMFDLVGLDKNPRIPSIFVHLRMPIWIDQMRTALNGHRRDWMDQMRTALNGHRREGWLRREGELTSCSMRCSEKEGSEESSSGASRWVIILIL